MKQAPFAKLGRHAPWLICAGLLLSGCAASTSGRVDSPTEIEKLRAQVKSLQDENTLLGLKLQEEIERGTIQLYLTRQEIVAAKREAAATRAKCGAPCADTP